PCCSVPFSTSTSIRSSADGIAKACPATWSWCGRTRAARVMTPSTPATIRSRRVRRDCSKSAPSDQGEASPTVPGERPVPGPPRATLRLDRGGNGRPARPVRSDRSCGPARGNRRSRGPGLPCPTPPAPCCGSAPRRARRDRFRHRPWPALRWRGHAVSPVDRVRLEPTFPTPRAAHRAAHHAATPRGASDSAPNREHPFPPPSRAPVERPARCAPPARVRRWPRTEWSAAILPASGERGWPRRSRKLHAEYEVIEEPRSADAGRHGDDGASGSVRRRRETFINDGNIVHADRRMQPEHLAHRRLEPRGIIFPGLPGTFRGPEGLTQRQRLAALSRIEVGVAAAERQAVYLANGRGDNQLEGPVQVARHLSNQDRLLDVFLPEDRDVRLNYVEQLRHNREHAGEMSRPHLSFPALGRAAGHHPGLRAGRVHRLHRRHKQRVHSAPFGQRAVTIEGARVAAEVFLRTELQR